ncbi:FAD:protein FMN transferase [Oenococcus oeni]|uniref:FAD:protein FMN transferase n=22 Tax=Oenococcus oeni TaxID=1247 RepID=A0A483BCD5_OENOE|nr:FAD:protein FMN transferase [Oenococcus oeni]EAV39865.1 thiamine biosynthesis lipoprotein [Oenococcus oeni ATCC BAA-1163]MDI4583700.1 FAD:protein FMN transferase [Oenococcus sp. UCMA 14587]EJO00354.1 thiamine biosynthesis membrane-associated lipoprotein [Oenococcus oeni AWRIB419]EJO03304.1 thiamine biosynthesis membrane-associated lipoprotein [Oenococcus oeni AWRIB418]EJO05003.1 thiamine biosynthesis membrane-associated lipoprotein [Oenococcus oeni AWRIB548]
MKKKIWVFLVLIVLSLSAIFAYFYISNKQKSAVQYADVPYQKNEFLMGTICTLTIYDKGKSAVLNKGMATIRHFDKEATLTEKGSVLDKINANAGIKPVKVPDDFWPLIEKAMYFSKNSDGSFDMAIGAVTNLWKIGLPGARVPSDSEIKSALPLLNYHDVILNKKKHTVYLTRKGMRLDFGGIAKGYIADQVKKTFLKNHVTSAIVSLGGNIYVIGKSHPTSGTRDWNVGIQNPNQSRGSSVGYVRESDMSIVTAGTYEQYLISHGHKYIYLMNPKTGYPYENNLVSVTIISKKSVDGDALSNAAFDKGLKKGLKYMNKKNKQNIQAIFITKDKKIYITNGLKNNFKLTNHKFKMGN